MDYRNNLDDQNIIIYGHHRKDGIMFGDIDLLFKENFYKKNNGVITLVIGNETREYQIFSVYSASILEDYNLTNYESFKEKIDEFKNKSEIDFNKDLSNIKQIITLSTCHNNNKDRLVIHGYEK
jgi:sortase B